MIRDLVVVLLVTAVAIAWARYEEAQQAAAHHESGADEADANVQAFRARQVGRCECCGSRLDFKEQQSGLCADCLFGDCHLKEQTTPPAA